MNTAYGIDVPRIVPFAEKQAERMGVGDRFQAITADFFTDPWPAPIDMTLFVNIFHLQPAESARQLLRHCADSIADDGVVCIVDHIVDREGDLDSPQDRFAMLFAASMLATGAGTRTRSAITTGGWAGPACEGWICWTPRCTGACLPANCLSPHYQVRKVPACR